MRTVNLLGVSRVNLYGTFFARDETCVFSSIFVLDAPHVALE